MNRFLKCALFIGIAGLMAFATTQVHADDYWTGSVSSDFSDPANWGITSFLNDPAMGGWMHVDTDSPNIATISTVITHQFNDLYVGFGGHTAEVDQTTGSSVTFGNAFWVGSYGNGFYNMTGGTINETIGGSLMIGSKSGSVGRMDMSNDATVYFTDMLHVGEDGGVGTLNMSGTAHIEETSFAIIGDSPGGQGTLTMSGNSTYHQTGGGLTCFLVGYQGGNGTITLNDSAAITADGGVYMGAVTWQTAPYLDAGNVSVINLNGGVLATPAVVGTGVNGSQTVNFNGGTLKAMAEGADYFITRSDVNPTMVVNVQAGGAKVDTNGFSISFGKPLVHNGTGTDGGLTVSDSSGTNLGILTLSQANTYTGMTTVNNGTLKIAAIGALPGSATINDNATLSLTTTIALSGQLFGGTLGTVSIDPGSVATLGTNSFSGTILANGGNLTLNGTHPGSLIVNNESSWYHNGSGTVAGLTIVGGNGSSSQDALLGGTGTLGDVMVLPNWGNNTGIKGGIEAGQNGAGSLHVAGLTFNGPGSVYVGNSSVGIGTYTGSNAAIIASGALSNGATGTSTDPDSSNKVKFDLGNANIAPGTYHLIQHVGAISYPNGGSIDSFSVVNAILSARETGSIVDNAAPTGNLHTLDYYVQGSFPIWSGVVSGATNNTWTPNNHAVTNWKANTNGSAFFFIDATDPAYPGGVGDAVVFNDDAGAAHSTVSIPANVAPVSVTVDNTMSYAFTGAGAITDGTSSTKTTLSKKNTGTLVINTPNTYSGGTTIYNGTIQIGNASALGTNGVAFYPDTAASTVKLQLFGNSITLSNLSTIAAAPGTSVVENGATGNATLTVTNSVANTFAGTLQDGAAGKLAVTFNNTANFLLSGINTYSDDTTLSGYGMDLQIGVNNALPHGACKGNLVFNGGNLDLNGHDVIVNGLAMTSSFATITNKVPGTTQTLTVGDNNTTSAYDGYLLDADSPGTGKLALAKIGTGTLLVSSTNNYSGGTTISAGTLQTGFDSALGFGSVSVSSGSTLDLQSAGLSVNGASGTGVITTTLAGNYATLTFNTAWTMDLSFNGVIQNGTGTMSVAKTGAGIQTLTALNTYTGATTVNGGTLVVSTLANGGVASSIGASTADGANLLFTGGTLHYTGPAIAIDRSFKATAGTSGLTLDSDLTLSANIDSTGGTLNKNGAGSLILANPSDRANIIAGNFCINAGPAEIASGSYQTLGWMRIGDNGNSASLKMTSSQLTVGGDLDLADAANTSATLDMSGTSHIEVTGGLDINDGNSQGKSCTITMTDTASITTGDYMTLGGYGSTAKIIVNSGNSLTIGGGVWLGSGSGANSTLTVLGGTVHFVGDSYIGDNWTGDVAPIGTVTLSGGAKFTSDGLLNIGDIGGQGHLDIHGTSTVTANGIFTVGYAGNTTGIAPSEVTVDGTASVLIVHNTTPDAFARTDDLYIGWLGGNGTWNQNGGTTSTTHTVTLSDAATGQPSSGVVNLRAGVFTAPGFRIGEKSGHVAADTVAVVNFDGGTLQANAGNAEFFDQSNSTVGNVLKLNVLEHGAVIDTNGYDIGTVAALLHGGLVTDTDGGLKKLGSGTLTLGGPIGYNGPTLINAGTLSIDNGLTTNLTTISGVGSLTVGATKAATVLNATSIQVDTLTIGHSGTVASSANAVPEPSTIVLLIITALMALVIRKRMT